MTRPESHQARDDARDDGRHDAGGCGVGGAATWLALAASLAGCCVGCGGDGAGAGAGAGTAIPAGPNSSTAATATPSATAAAAAAAAAAAGAPDARDQYALLAELLAADALPEEARAPAYAATRASWEKRRFTWEVLHVPKLCDPAACYVVPFDQSRFPRPIVQGWMPRLVLGGERFAALDTACKLLTPCVVRIEGTLATLDLAAGLPPAATFDDVRIAGARAVAPGERWGGAMAPPAPGP